MVACQHFDFLVSYVTTWAMTVIPNAIVISGLIRKRKWFWDQSAVRDTSSAVCEAADDFSAGDRQLFPARMYNGTPFQRQESTF